MALHLAHLLHPADPHGWRHPKAFRLDTAFSGRDAEFAININCAATEPAEFEHDREWVRGWFDALTPHSTGGVYVNFMGEEGEERVRAAYGEEKYRRLGELKAKYDPDNVFRVNQNIKPAG